MKKAIKLSSAIAECVALCYQSMQAAKEYARSITSDPLTPESIKVDFTHVSVYLDSPIERIDKRIPPETREQWITEIKNNDHLRLENIKNIYIRLDPDRQDMAEIMMEGILKGELTFESNATP
jgi:hypothetical protein